MVILFKLKMNNYSKDFCRFPEKQDQTYLGKSEFEIITF